jgi:hypothetical protein
VDSFISLSHNEEEETDVDRRNVEIKRMYWDNVAILLNIFK